MLDAIFAAEQQVLLVHTQVDFWWRIKGKEIHRVSWELPQPGEYMGGVGRVPADDIHVGRQGFVLVVSVGRADG